MNITPSTPPTRGRTKIPVVGGIAVLVALALVAVIAVLITAHQNGSANPGVAHIGPTPTTTSQTSTQGNSSRAAAFSTCMRAHGVPTFPDPDSQGNLYLKVTKGGPLDPNSPQFQAASQACKSLAPSKRSLASSTQLQAQGLKFAACMRTHGVPNFPDPKTSGGQFQIIGVNPNSPQFQSAMQACRSLMPGGGPGAGQ